VIVEIGHLYNPMWKHTTCPNEMCYFRFLIEKTNFLTLVTNDHPIPPLFSFFNALIWISLGLFIMFIILFLKYWKWNYTYIFHINSLICMYVCMHVHNYIFWCKFNVRLTSKSIQYIISEFNCFIQKWSSCDQ